ncbi:MAG: beta-propeller fold lactonase family protein [Saprospiraceae bacterium]
MKNFQNIVVVLVFSIFVISCAKENLTSELNDFPVTEELNVNANDLLLDDAGLLALYAEEEGVDSRMAGFQSTVYTLSNEVSGNEVIAFDRNKDGTITESGRYATGGLGSGGGLGNQGALALSKTGKFLYAVNAGSNDFSVFYIKSDGSLALKDKTNSGGELPISITERNSIIYLLNAGGDGNIAGFGFNNLGNLTAIPNSVKPLSGPAPGPAQISFSPNGKALIVTEKATNLISSYAVVANRPSDVRTFPSAGQTPFGFDFGNNNNFYVSEAAGGVPGASTVSSYHVDNAGHVNLVDGPEATNQTAACWLVLTKNKNHLFTTNTGSSNISTVMVSGLGNLNAIAGITSPAMSSPIDAALDKDSKFLYVLASGTDAILSYEVGPNGELTQIDTDDNNLPDRMTGLIVR